MAKNKDVVTIEIAGKDWEKALDKAFKKKVKEVKVDGFRKIWNRIFIYGCCK